MQTSDVFTFFGKGHYSKIAGKCVPSVDPQESVNIEWVYDYIKSECARWATEELRRMFQTLEEQTEEQKRIKEKKLRDFKLLQFDAVAFAGTFHYGSANGIDVRTNFIALDIDDLVSTEEARRVQQLLIADEEVETVLCFVSPKGHGVKWVVEIPEWCQGFDFSEQYLTLCRHIGCKTGLLADLTCSNVNRLCFLPYDPECFINTKYLSK